MQNNIYEDLQANETLRTSDLESYSDFIKNKPELPKRGVYIWGFRFFDENTGKTSEFIPYYVGKHRVDIHKRIEKHVYDLKHGTHKILKKEVLLGPKPFEYFRSKEPVFHVYLHKIRGLPDVPPKMELNQEERENLDLHVKCYVENLYISYIDVGLLELKELENKYIDYLERYIQDSIKKKGHPLSSRPGIKYPSLSFHPVIKPGKGMENTFL
jgi:hypothetical protein